MDFFPRKFKLLCEYDNKNEILLTESEVVES